MARQIDVMLKARLVAPDDLPLNLLKKSFDDEVTSELAKEMQEPEEFRAEELYQYSNEEVPPELKGKTWQVQITWASAWEDAETGELL